MTTRTSFDHTKRELAAKGMGVMANGALSRQPGRFGKVAQAMIAKKVGEVPHDPDLEHPADWDRPID